METTTKEATSWPPNYTEILRKRVDILNQIQSDPVAEVGSKEYYRTRPIDFIDDWCVTYDPRNVGRGLPTLMPFHLFPRQRDLVQFLYDCMVQQESGLIEKCRDMGATWVCAAFSVWLYIYHSGSSTGWGSRKEQLVDKIGDPDSIFQKIRMILEYLPAHFKPKNYNPKIHASYMKIINPENGSTITGEAGDNIGRGGRKGIYFKDEAQPVNTPVLTPTGWVKMADINPNDYVIGSNGQQTKVTHINECGIHDVYRLTFSDGTSTESSTNHLWTVDKVYGARKRLTMRTHEIYRDFKQESPNGHVKYKYCLPTVEPVHFSTPVDIPLDPYVLGALLGDGSVNGGIRFCSEDPEIVEEIGRRLPDGVVIKKTVGEFSYGIGDENRYTKKSRARLAVKMAGIHGMVHHNKCVPESYRLLAPEQRLEVLQGLMDTDGCGCANGAIFSTVSKQLAKDVVFLTQSLGGTATLNAKFDKRYDRDGYYVHVILPEGLVPFKLQRKINKLSKRKHPQLRTVVNVELLGREEVKCITVDADDGLYVTNDFILTHNSAHYERPDKIEAALGDNTDVQIDISSVNGAGNVFHRRRQSGIVYDPKWSDEKKASIPKGTTRIFIMDWSDHPAKDQVWYDARKAKAEREGLLHVFMQEVDRDYSSAVEGILIPGRLVKACLDAHISLANAYPETYGQYTEADWIEGTYYGGFDPYDEGLDSHALVGRRGSMITYAEMWFDGDTGDATRKVSSIAQQEGMTEIDFDSPGVGAGVKTESARLKKENLLPKHIQFIPWNGGTKVRNPNHFIFQVDDPDEQKTVPKNKDFFKNLKAQAGWALRTRCQKTFEALTKGTVFPLEELLSIPSTLEPIEEFKQELSQPTYSRDGAGRIVIDKKPKGTKSPNLFDATVQAFYPIEIFDPTKGTFVGGPGVVRNERTHI